MQTFSTDYASQHFEELLAQVAQGETLLLIRNGKPLARLVPFGGEDGAEVPPSEVEEAFYGD